MKFTDFHVHPYLNSGQYTNMYHSLSAREEKDTMKKIRSDMERAGIGHICGSVIDGRGGKWDHSFEYLQKLNRDALELKELSEGFYTPGFHIHPGFVRESIKEIEYMVKQGVRLIGELVPYAHGAYRYSDRGLTEIFHAAEEYGMIVSYHTTDDDDVDQMIESHPKITFIAAHPGEKHRLIRHLKRMEKYENLYLDLSGTGLQRLGVLAYGVELVGAERFLFGTDYPINNPAMYAKGVIYEMLTKEEKELVCYKNAERILGVRI